MAQRSLTNAMYAAKRTVFCNFHIVRTQATVVPHIKGGQRRSCQCYCQYRLWYWGNSLARQPLQQYASTHAQPKYLYTRCMLRCATSKYISSQHASINSQVQICHQLCVDRFLPSYEISRAVHVFGPPLNLVISVSFSFNSFLRSSCNSLTLTCASSNLFSSNFSVSRLKG